MQSNNYLAIDLGASSGRLIVSNNEELVEVHRFADYLKNENGFLVWDIDFIYQNIIIGLKKAVSKYKNIQSLAIDSWGVDYVLLNNNQVIKPVYSYRDTRTNESSVAVHNIIPFIDLYKISGIQYSQFNSIYQLKSDLDHNRLNNVTDFLSIPEYLSYLLTGKKIKEYTMATTSGLIDLSNGEYSKDIINKLKLPNHLFPKVVKPPYLLGSLKEEIVKEIGTNINVIMCASHDTASAFEAVDVSDDTIILSSGTWSLIGVKLLQGNNSEDSYKSNFTNEGGVGYIRYLKNIMGMWILNEIRKITKHSFEEISQLVNVSNYPEIFDVNDLSLLSPQNMKDAVIKLLSNNPPKNDGDLYRSVYYSLAHSYLKACEQLENNLHKKYNNICIVGGGAKNMLLNKIIEEVTKRKVIALPIEATAIGNIKVQKLIK